MFLQLENSSSKHTTKPIFTGSCLRCLKWDCWYWILLGRITNFWCSKLDRCHCNRKLLKLQTTRSLQMFGGSSGIIATGTENCSDSLQYYREDLLYLLFSSCNHMKILLSWYDLSRSWEVEVYGVWWRPWRYMTLSPKVDCKIKVEGRIKVKMILKYHV